MAAVELAWFRAAYEQYFAFTWRSLRYLGVPEALLDDAAQEVWLVVYRRCQDFEARSQLKTWLFGIAVNVERNLRRIEGRRGERVPLPGELQWPGADPAQERESKEAWDLVQHFVETLDDTRRTVFIAGLVEELSAAEVSTLTGLDVITVYNRIRALRRSFRLWVEQGEAAR